MFWEDTSTKMSGLTNSIFRGKKLDSLVLAFNDLETHEIERLYNQGIANGLNKNELQILNRGQCLGLEPNVNPQISTALLCTGSHIVDPVCLTKKLVESAVSNRSPGIFGKQDAKVSLEILNFL